MFAKFFGSDSSMSLTVAFAFWICGVWCTYGLEIHLQETWEKLEPYVERQIFQHHPHRPSSYRLLRGLPIRTERSATAEDDRYVRESSISITLPVEGVDISLTLNQINIADPGLTLKVNGEEVDDVTTEMEIDLDCFYSGGEESNWVIISTCTGVNGVVSNNGNTYQVEQINGPDERLGRHRRDESQPLFVVYPVRSSVSEKKDLPVPDGPEDLPSMTTDPTYSDSLGGAIRATRVRRRTVSGPYTVELAVFVDRTLYSYVKKRYPNSNQNTKTVEIVMTLVNAVHRLYSDSSLGNNKVGMLVKKVEVLPSTKPNSAGGDIYRYLKNFCQWQKDENPEGSAGHWDHALLLSGHDLWNDVPTENSTVGLAYVGGMCSSTYSCTINEATTFAAAYIIAHEMGHNFDMKHDGGSDAMGCAPNEYIMSPVMASGATKWSSCSKSALNNFLKAKGNCLTESATSNTKVGDRTHEGQAPGKRFDADDQCHYMYGKDWSHFEAKEKPFNNVCREIWCRNGRLLKTPTASALEGTSCGKNKVCRRGTCKDENNSEDKGSGKSDNGKKEIGDPDKGKDDLGNGWEVINIIPHDGGDSGDCIPGTNDCDNYTSFLGHIFGGGNFLGGVFNSIFKGLGVCEDKCKR